jgi:hypothetical protein
MYFYKVRRILNVCLALKAAHFFCTLAIAGVKIACFK